MRIEEIVEALGCLDGKRVQMECVYGKVVQDVERVRYLSSGERVDRRTTIILDSGRPVDRRGRPNGVCFDSRGVASVRANETGAVIETRRGALKRLEVVEDARDFLDQLLVDGSG